VFAVVLIGVILFLFLVVYDRGEPWDDFAEAAQKIVNSENADAIAFLPYSDGPLVPKPAIYDRELMGGKGGYRTPDGERIYVDGQGNGKFSLQGVDAILAIDPTEHAAAADPLKAYVAHQNDLGRWILVDREGTVVEAGDALQSVDDVTPAMEQPQAAATDGGHASAVHEKAAADGMELQQAKETLEQEGKLHKIVDLAPPRAVHVDEETGEVDVEEATHVAVDVSSAANLLPKKTNTTAWQVVEEKARQEGMNWDERRKDILIGVVVGGGVVGVAAVVIALVMGFM